MKPETIAIHSGHEIDAATGAVIPPIHLSTTFERQPDGSYPHEFVYSRDANPNRQALEMTLCALEEGALAASFASGSMAMMAILQALKPGDHVLVPEDIYYGIRKILTEIFVPWGLQVTFVDMSDMVAVKKSLQANTRLLITETPSNPLLNITDLAAVAAIAHENDALLVCDNTIATPVAQKPLSLGADLVVHATTKYLSGHSDVIGGVVIAKEESTLFEKILFLQKVGGAVPSPFDCWLTQRGLQTLPYRVRAQAENAHQIANYLANHPAIELVRYPGLPQHPHYAVAARQMSHFGALMSIQVRGDEARAMQVAARIKLFTRATSFGGTHSLIEHRASIEHPDTTTPRNLLRISVGLEHVDDLIADLDQALTL